MIKGCQKRVLWVKNIESDCFDGALFIVSDKSVVRKQSESSMVAEANRIISSCPITNYFGVDDASEGAEKKTFLSRYTLWFTVGLILGAAISFFIKIF